MHLLHPLRNHLARTRLAAALTVALALPVCLIADNAWADGSTTSSTGSLTIINSDYNSEMTTPAGSFSFKVHGDIDFTEAEDDVASIKGKAIIKDTRGKHTHEIRFEPGANGDVARSYLLDSHEHALDDEGKRWLATAIQNAIRDSGLNAEKRTRRLLKSGGPDAVLAEIDKMSSSNARRIYIGYLVADAKLDDKTLARLLTAIGKIDSDFERRASYTAIINTQTINVANMDLMLSEIGKLGSDFEKRTTLSALVPKLIADDGVRQAWLATVKTIGADFERRTVVTALVQSNNPAINVDWALASTNGIGAAFEVRTALMAISDKMRTASDAQVAAYAHAAKHIDADFERRTALIALMEKTKLSHNGCISVLDAIDGMGSGFEIRTTMVVLAGQMPADTDLIARYHKIADRLGNFEREQAERALAHPI